MKIEEYKDLAMRTLAQLPNHKEDVAHMALGIVSEWGESLMAALKEDKPNVIEEHGDSNWFVAGICHLYGLDFADIYNDAKAELADDRETEDKTILAGFRIAGMAKDYLAYNREINKKKLRKQLVLYVSSLKMIANEEGFDYGESLQKNIEKLKIRFPHRFDEDRANNRNLSAEREVLKG